MAKHKPPLDQSIRQHAREMRSQPTEPERQLWKRLRRKQLGGYKFRRQHAIDRYIVDFYCHSANLVIEVDGESHVNQQEYDIVRTSKLEFKGLTVIRFTNKEVMSNIEGVLRVILNFCENPHLDSTFTG